MENWFTVEQIDPDTFAISEYRHWEETHCYLLCGEKRAVLIDTGLGVSNIKKVVDSLTELPVMAVTTHVHWDHIGGHQHFDHIAVHEAEKDWLSVNFSFPWSMRLKPDLNNWKETESSSREMDCLSFGIFRFIYNAKLPLQKKI